MMKKGNRTFATEILGDMKRQLIGCRIALVISLTVNIIMAAVLFGRQ